MHQHLFIVSSSLVSLNSQTKGAKIIDLLKCFHNFKANLVIFLSERDDFLKRTCFVIKISNLQR